MNPPIQLNPRVTSERSSRSDRPADVIVLSDIRSRRRAEAEEAVIDEIIASVQHVDVVRLFELAAEREAKRQMAQT